MSEWHLLYSIKHLKMHMAGTQGSRILSSLYLDPKFTYSTLIPLSCPQSQRLYFYFMNRGNRRTWVSSLKVSHGWLERRCRAPITTPMYLITGAHFPGVVAWIYFCWLWILSQSYLQLKLKQSHPRKMKINVGCQNSGFQSQLNNSPQYLTMQYI